MKPVKILGLAIIFSLALVGAGNATTISVNGTHWQFGPPEDADTGIQLNVGDSLTILVDPADTWVIRSDGLSCNADGYYLEPYDFVGLTAFAGTMIGRIDSGPYFIVGTAFGTKTVTESGHLFLMCYDSVVGDNSGFINANVLVNSPAVPIPGSILLLGAGLCRLAIYRRRKLTNRS